MHEYCFVAPVVPGGMERMQSWIQQGILNNRDHDRVFQEAGINREQLWLQHTPMGDFAVVSFGTDDPAKAFHVLQTSSDPWAVQFRDFVKATHGLDLSQPLPLNEQLVDWNVTERTRVMQDKNMMK